jgi:polysaccharide export outer membrane protein
VEEITERPVPIDSSGNIDLPLVGTVKAAGLSVTELEAKLVELLKRYVRQPQVSITVAQFRSEPVFLNGAFRAPGIYSLQGGRTLIEMISSAGGLLPNASRRIKVTRKRQFGSIPLPNAVESPDGTETSVIVSLGSLRDNVNPAEDIILQPYDSIAVERSESIFVGGAVARAGALELQERDSMSVLQVLSVSGGLRADADAKSAKILRPILNTDRRAEIPIDLTLVLKGKSPDFAILPNDLLFVPQKPTFSRNIGRVLLIAIPVTATILVSILR